MRISARVQNGGGKHQVVLSTNEQTHTLAIAPKSTGFGSSVNGGELLLLALATCYCNDLYREAAKRGLSISGVEVEAEADFGAEGEPARSVSYRAKVVTQEGEDVIRDLMRHTDRVAEIQNTLRAGNPVALTRLEVAVG
jgi:organic hydroperoxide reductase OsmC/OhrA